MQEDKKNESGMFENDAKIKKESDKNDNADKSFSTHDGSSCCPIDNGEEQISHDMNSCINADRLETKTDVTGEPNLSAKEMAEQMEKSMKDLVRPEEYTKNLALTLQKTISAFDACKPKIDTEGIASALQNLTSIMQPEEYTQNIASTLENVIPVLNACKPNIDIDKMASTLQSVTSNIDTSWLHIKPEWNISTDILLHSIGNVIEPSYFSSLYKQEQETSRFIGENGEITSIAAQLASITENNILEDKWKQLIAPQSLLDDLQSLAIQQHQAIQKEGVASEWRLSVLESASRYTNRQVTWTENIVSELQDKVNNSDQDYQIDDESVLPLIPQYIGYTKRENEETSPEEAFEKSQLVQITEKGKMIIDNVVKINDICAAKQRRQLFSYTGKTMKASCAIGNIFCKNLEQFGVMIDCFYFIFYENIERIKELVTEQAVQEEDIYQWIFRVKHLRTDLRHDYEHGKDKDIAKKRKIIMDCYEHYVGKPTLIKQKDYVLFQKKLYDEVLLMEEHLLNILCSE